MVGFFLHLDYIILHPKQDVKNFFKKNFNFILGNKIKGLVSVEKVMLSTNLDLRIMRNDLIAVLASDHYIVSGGYSLEDGRTHAVPLSATVF